MLYPAKLPSLTKGLAPMRFRQVAFFVALASIGLISQYAYADGSSGTPALTHQQLQQGYDDYVGLFPKLLAQPDLPLPGNAPKNGGKAIVTIELAASGELLSAKITQSSGSSPIDQFALQDAMQTHYPRFNSRMPYKSYSFVLPITVSPPPPSAATYSPSGPIGPGSTY